MEFVEQTIINILEKKPSECAYLDYKQYPYPKNKKHDFIKDVIAMLNSEEGFGKDKVIIFGVVDKSRFLKGIDINDLPDDNIYQSWIDVIKPRPNVQSGFVEFEGKKFGYVYIHKINLDRVYEVSETIVGDSSAAFSEKNAAFKGQAYSRHGSSNYIMMREDRNRIKDAVLETRYSSVLRAYEPSHTSSNMSSVLIAAIIGCWNEDFEGDIEVVEKISGLVYKDFIDDIRKFHVESPDQYLFENKRWKINSRIEIIDKLGSHIYDESFDEICIQILNVLLKVNPKYELESDKRFVASIYGKKQIYSSEILLGLAEFMALAGNNKGMFISCSKYKVNMGLKNIIEKVFDVKDWKVLASLSDVLQPIAESYPEVFLKEIQKRLEEKQPSLLMYLHEGEKGVTTIQYGWQLGNALSILACLPEYFSEACYAMLLLSIENDSFLSRLTGILLPWFPQTNASNEVRIGIIKGFFTENDNLAWKLLISLLPGKTTTGMPIARPKYLEHKDIPESVSNKDYWYVSKSYLKIAANYAKGQPQKLVQLVEFLDNVPKEGFEILIKSFKDSCEDFTKDEQKELVWNDLKDLVNKHRKYKDAEWSLPEEALIIIDQVISRYQPKNLIIQMRRIFRNKQYDLIWDEDDWMEKEKRLKNDQVDSIAKIYDKYGYYKVRDFANFVDRPEIVGICFADCSVKQGEIEEILSLLVNENNNLQRFAKGYVQGNFHKTGYLWMKQILDTVHNDIIKASILSNVPLSKKSWEFIECISDNSKSYFWTKVEIGGSEIENEDELEFVTEYLIANNRVSDAVELSYHYVVVEKRHPKTESVIGGLNALIYQQNNISRLNVHAITSLIKWLQKNSDSYEDLGMIEWKYLNLLNSEYGIEPLTLYRSLSNEPVFFIDVLSKAYRGHNEEPKELSKEEKVIAKHCGALLFSWKRIPGLIDENTLDESAFKVWVEKVVELSKKLDRYEVAMTYLGHTLYYAPKDKDGFFINNSVAKLLQSDVEKHIRNGYSTEAYNSRGAHFIDTSGKTEFELEDKYLKRAEEAEARGYFRFGSTLREIAKSYHQEAIHNIEEERQWNTEYND